MTTEDRHFNGRATYEDEPVITPTTALVVIAQELRGIRRVLYAMAFDPDCDSTVLGKIETHLQGNLQTFDEDGETTSIAEHVAAVARR